MTCPREEILSRRHDGELPEPELRELESHLAGCPACRDFEGKLRTLDHLLTLPLGADTRLARARARGGGRRTTVWFAAASLLAALTVFGVASRVRPRPVAETGVVNYQVASPEGGTYHITVEGDARLLSIEVNGTVAHFAQETSP